MNKAFALVTLLFLSLSPAWAGPYIDPALQQLMSADHHGDTRHVRVIAYFNDKLAAENQFPHAAQFHQAVETAMIRNAQQSQARFLAQLRASRQQGAPIRTFSLWLFNAMVVDVPVNQLPKLVSGAEEVKALVLNRRIQLPQDRNFLLVAPPSRGQSAYTYGLEKIGIPALNTKAPKVNGAGVRVGILDTGIDPTHPDLKDRLAVFKDFVGTNPQPYDDHGHGTHVAGTISGGNTSGTQIGIAPAVKLISGKIFDKNGSATQELIMRGMQWIADPDGNPGTPDFPMVVSNSWGANMATSGDPANNWLCKGVVAWTKLGILGVFANGNSGPGPSSVNLPAACPNVIGVGATDANDQIANFSSRGPAKWSTGSLIRPSVSAPGVKVMSSVPGGKYATWDGTSMATPHVTGLAALFYQVNPKATIEEATKAIQEGAHHLGASGVNNDYGYGRIDVMTTIKTAFFERRP